MSTRTFIAKPPGQGVEPLLVGMIGPPAGGKTVSSLRLAVGMQRVRKGRIVLIDTEGGRSRKYHRDRGGPFDFDIVDFEPPFQSHYFLEAIQQQIPNNPSCVIVDSQSDEHEGEGGYLEWHDAMVEKMGGNEWAAWSKPAASRRRLITGILHIKVPLIFTFRGREKTAQVDSERKKGKKDIIKIGWQPVAPLEIVHALDLTCILPNNANGVPVWTTELAGEQAIIKRPSFLASLVPDGQITEEMGERLALWQLGKSPSAEKPPIDPQRQALLDKILAHLKEKYPGDDEVSRQSRQGALYDLGLETTSWKKVANELPMEKLQAAVKGIEEAE